MHTISFTDARNHLKTVLDQVASDATPTIISRRDAADAVIMSLDYYNSLMETLHLLKTPANAAHLQRSITQYHSGAAHTKELTDE